MKSGIQFAFGSFTIVFMACVLCLVLPAHAADTLLINGHVYTGNTTQPWAEGVAISGDHIDAVGTTAEMNALKQPKTRVIDLGGRTVIPGMIDSHAHTWLGSMALHGLNLSTPQLNVWPQEQDKLVTLFRAYAKAHSHDKVLLARMSFDVKDTAVNRKVLDRAIADRPVIVHNWSEHVLWLNSKALQLAGITAQPLPDALEENGVSREANGEPRGLVQEAAMQRVEQAVFKTVPREQQLAMVREAVRYLNRLGITMVVNASGSLSEMELYATLKQRHQLTVRMRTSMGSVGVPHRLTPQFLEQLETAKRRYHDDWLSANLVKIFADGAGRPSDAYTDAQLRELTSELDRRGYQLMTHALMPATVHTVLDVYQALAEKNGPRDRRLRIEHAGIVTDQDLPRFAAQSVIASMQPTFCCGKPIPGWPVTDRWRSLLDSGATLAFGSDWPCEWPPNPFISISQTVTRSIWAGRHLFGAAQGDRKPTGDVNAPAERITVQESVDAFTRGAAFATFMDHKLGTLEAGKLADLVVLSQDIFAVAPEQIAATYPTLTMVGGQVVFEAAQ